MKQYSFLKIKPEIKLLIGIIALLMVIFLPMLLQKAVRNDIFKSVKKELEYEETNTQPYSASTQKEHKGMKNSKKGSGQNHNGASDDATLVDNASKDGIRETEAIQGGDMHFRSSFQAGAKAKSIFMLSAIAEAKTKAQNNLYVVLLENAIELDYADETPFQFGRKKLSRRQVVEQLIVAEDLDGQSVRADENFTVSGANYHATVQLRLDDRRFIHSLKQKLSEKAKTKPISANRSLFDWFFGE